MDFTSVMWMLLVSTFANAIGDAGRSVTTDALNGWSHLRGRVSGVRSWSGAPASDAGAAPVPSSRPPLAQPSTTGHAPTFLEGCQQGFSQGFPKAPSAFVDPVGHRYCSAHNGDRTARA